MPRNLGDLNDNERRALLNKVWEQMAHNEAQAIPGVKPAPKDPLGPAGPLPHDLNDVMKAWKIINGVC